MTWARLSDDFTDRPEILALSLAAGWLHVEALVWCNKHLTDGHLPAAALGRLAGKVTDPQAAVTELVTAGVWEELSDGWQLEWADQETAVRVKDRRQYRATVQANYRERGELHQRGDHSKCTEKCPQRRNETGHVTGNASGHRTGQLPPTRPDPSRPEEGTEKGHASLAARASSASAAERGAPAQPADEYDIVRDGHRFGPPPGVKIGVIVEEPDWDEILKPKAKR